MPLDIFDAVTLDEVVRELRRAEPRTGLLGAFFPVQKLVNTESILIDVEVGRRRIAPFVSPKVAGKIVRSEGFRTDSFRPAYIKDKRLFRPEDADIRQPGEAIGGGSSPSARLLAQATREIADQRRMVRRRLEVMAGEALHAGHVTVSGEDYPTRVVDFGRDASLEVTLTGAARWGQTGVNPLSSLADWLMLGLRLSGAAMRTVVMTDDVWRVFKDDSNVERRLDVQRRLTDMPSLAQTAIDGDGLTYMGMVDGFQIWTYAGWYVDPADDLEKPILPAGTVLMAAPSELEGRQIYGRIMDLRAPPEPVDVFVKEWVEEDPSGRYLLAQSAPLVAPFRPNASFRATVL